MPKLAERHTIKYGFQCLEKNMTRFEAECTCQVKVDTKKRISTGSPVRFCTELGFYSPKQLLDAGC